MHRKSDIENAGLSGLPVPFQSVARISRAVPTLIQLRHQWAESVDGRVWQAVKAAVAKGAQKRANHLREEVSVYNHDGVVIGVFVPQGFVQDLRTRQFFLRPGPGAEGWVIEPGNATLLTPSDADVWVRSFRHRGFDVALVTPEQAEASRRRDLPSVPPHVGRRAC